MPVNDIAVQTWASLLTGGPVGAAIKREASLTWRDGYGADYGEQPPRHVTNSSALYVQSQAVNASVNSFSNRVVTAGLNLYQRGPTGEGELVLSHSVLDLLTDPNPWLRRSELFWYTVSDLLLSGNAYWFLSGPMNGQPQEIWRMNPRNVRLVRSSTEYVSGYIYEIDGQRIPLDIDEVIHLKLPNPGDEFYGLSRLAAAALSAMTGKAMADWNNTMFGQDNAIPAGIVTLDEWVDDDTFDEIKLDWRRNHGSGVRRTAFMRGGKVQYQTIGLSQKDVDFLAGAQWEDEKVYRVFGCYHLLPAKSSDDRKVNERLFLEEHAYPMLVYIAEVITDLLLPYWVQPRTYYAEFDDIRPRERALDLEEQREKAKGLTVNEWREQQQMEILVGGDDVMFIHMVSGAELAFERDARPAPPPQLQAFTEPDDDEDESDADKPQTADENAEDRESRGDDVGDDIGASTDRSVSLKDVQDELRQFEKFTLARLGQKDTRVFEFDVLPGYVQHEIDLALDGATSLDEIKAALQPIGSMLEEDYAPVPIREYALTQENYKSSLLELIELAFEGDIESRPFLMRGKSLIKIHFTTAFFDGMAEMGVITETLSIEENDDLNDEIKLEQSYFLALRNSLFKSMIDAGPEALLTLKQSYMKRIDVWVTKGLGQVFELGKLSAQANKMMEWIVTPGKDTCKTCKAADGQIHRAKDWKRVGLRPRVSELACGGFECGCTLSNTEQRARGVLSRIPKGDS